ncbi:MAG: TonB-dependent receptor [Acidobacteria bacterium]|nr:TonB-dependent receptor [Acidobacteriota bacterium]
MHVKASASSLFYVSCLAFLLLKAFDANALAQQTTGTIGGIVKDETDARVPGVSVTIKNVDTGIARTALTDEEGRYHVPNLSPGNYEVRAELPGFQTIVRSGVTVTVGGESVVDVTLKVGELADQITITGEAPLVQTSTSDLSGLVEQKKIIDLPLNQRNFIQLATLQSGVIWQRNITARSASNIGYGMKILVAGSRPTGNNFLLDGTDINEPHGRTPGSATGSTLGVEAVREFRIYTKNYSAEFGRATGGVINVVTKSGTNKFHGSIFEFHRNDNLDARNFFDPGKNPPEFKRNQFGFALGGPIVQGKTFFYTNYEGLREVLGLTVISTVPSLTARQGLLPDPARPGQLRQINVKPSVRPFLEFYPVPNGRDFGDGRAEYVAPFAQTADEDYISARVDHSFSSSLSSFVRYTINDAEVFASGGGIYNTIPQQLADRDNSRKQYVTVELQKIFNASLINTLRAGYNQTVYTGDEVHLVPMDPLVLVPQTKRPAAIGVSGLARLGSSNLHPMKYAYHVYDLQDTVGYDIGSHSIKFGGQLQRIHQNSGLPSRRVGLWSFSTLEDFMLGRATSAQVAPPEIAEPHRAFRQNLIGLFLQDDYRVRPNLTLNLGLRYEPTTPFGEKQGRLSQIPQEKLFAFTGSVADIITTGDYYKNPDWKAFAPRIGFAWDPFGNGRNAVRGGLGVFYDHVYIRWLGSFLASRTPPSYNIIDQRTVDFPQTSDQLIARYGKVGTSAAFVQSHPATQYMMHWNLNVQRQIFPSTAVTIGYAGSRGVRLGRLVDLNNALPIEVTNGRPKFSLNPARPNPNFESITLLMTDSDSYYHGLEASLQKRWSSNFQFQVSYTWSKSIANAPGVRTSTDESDNSPTSHHLFFSKGYDRGPSAFHVPHNLNVNFSYALPGSQLTGLGGKLLGGWQTNLILTLASGSFFTVQTGTNARTGLIGTGRRPDLIPGKTNNPVLGGPDRYFDRSSFQPPDPQLWGTLGINTVHGPGVATFDFSLVKDTPVSRISEDFKIQFRFETFNLLNRANFATPSRTVFDGAGRPVGTAGRINETTTTSRQLQFGLKVLF